MTTISKQTINKGIEITVIAIERRYEVHIDITPEANISQKIKCEDFRIKFYLSNGAKKLQKTIHLQKKNLKYTKNSKKAHLVLQFKHNDYQCIVSLSPKVYFLYKIPNKFKEKRKTNNNTKAINKNKKIKINDKYRPGLAVGKECQYTLTNIARPYSGGLCSPK